MLSNGVYPAKYFERDSMYANFKGAMIPGITLGAYLGIILNASFYKHTSTRGFDFKSVLVLILFATISGVWWFLFFHFGHYFSVFVLFCLGFAPPLVALSFIFFAEYEKYIILRFIEKTDLSERLP